MSDDELSSEARDLIATVRTERTLTKAARERSYARIGVGIGVAASGVFAARSASGAGSSVGAATGVQTLVGAAKWWVIGGLIVTAGAAGVGAYAGSRSGAPERVAPARVETVELPLTPREEASADVAQPVASSAPPIPSELERRTARVKGPNASVPPFSTSIGPSPSATSAKLSTATTADDVLLLHRARAALRSNPANALSLAKNHERRFPRSQLGAEREVVTILALCSLGRANEAQRRAAALASRSPALTGLEGSCAERR
jgi:RNA polymerase sigma-70 factor (ECF subfamily)